MQTDYIRHLCDTYMPSGCVVYPTMQGVVVETPYIERVTKFLQGQSQAQFELNGTTNGSGITVNLNKAAKTVCKGCGSPEFITKVIKKYNSYIDPTHFKVRTSTLIMSEAITTCAYCKTTGQVYDL